VFVYRADPAETGGVGVAFTDRWGGVSEGPSVGTLNFGRTDVDNPEHVIENFSRLRRCLGVESVHVVHQVHGTDVHEVTDIDAASWTPASPLGDRAPGQSRLPVADIVVTGVAGAAVAVRIADCLPIVLAAPRQRLVSAVHAGRVGLLAGAITAALSDLRARGAGEVTAWIGPHICGDCYEVPADMAEQAADLLPATAARTRWGTPAIDLAAGAVSALEGHGVGVAYIGPCTRTDPAQFSHRGDPRAGRQLGLGWISG
jgi:YfiH family protein